jgi:hypothetical protein
MKALRGLLIASLSVAVLGAGAAHAASTTNFSDQWWVPTESGWGASVLQQSSTLFIDLMVYGADGKPTWFVVAATLQTSPPEGHTVFYGDLYAATGPYYGAGFNPTLVTLRKAGTLTFDAATASNATVSYTVDGTPVVKNLTRQTWRHENLGGTYDTVWKTGCGNPSPFDWEVSVTVIRHDADNSVTINVSCPYCMTDFHHDFRGNYTQSGHLGQITADLGTPDAGSITISEIAKTTAGFTGRFTGSMAIAGQTCQITKGQIGAVRQ